MHTDKAVRNWNGSNELILDITCVCLCVCAWSSDVFFTCLVCGVCFTVLLWGAKLASLLATSWAAAASGGPGQVSAQNSPVLQRMLGEWGRRREGEFPHFFHQTVAHAHTCTRTHNLSVFVFFVLCNSKTIFAPWWFIARLEI